MPISIPTIIVTGLFFLFILLSGYWLSKMGKPYGSFPFNIHKLIGLAAGIFLVIIVIRRIRVAPLDSREIAVLATTVLIFILTVIAGGLLGAEDSGSLKNLPQPVKTAISVAHKAFPYLALLSLAATLYLLK